MGTISDIDAVILCGGLGSRLKAVEPDKQKVMAEVTERPFLDLIIEEYRRQGVKRVVLCTGHKSGDVEKYYRNNDPGVEVVFSAEHSPLGTGGAVKNAEDLIKSDPFFVQNGDSFCRLDLKCFLDFHRNKKAMASLVVARAKDPQDFGTIILKEDGRIAGFLEKNKSDSVHLNAGIYCFDRKVFSFMPKEKNISLEYQLFPSLTKEDFFGFVVDERFWDIGTPERFEEAKRNFKI